MKITKEMAIAEVIELCPDAMDIFLEYGLHCVGCGAAMWESVEDGALGHGMSEELIESLMEEINEAREKSQKRDLKSSQNLPDENQKQNSSITQVIKKKK